MTTKRECGNCAYWDAMTDRAGECRRNPPSAPQDRNSDGERYEYGLWPTTGAREWCGEWEEREGE